MEEDEMAGTREIGMETELQEEEDDSETEILRDRFRLSAISITETEAKKMGMEISEPVVACIADLAFKYTEERSWVAFQVAKVLHTCSSKLYHRCIEGHEQLAKDLELFSQHGNRKSVNMEDVILCAHRNEHLGSLLRTFSNDLKAKEPQSERRRKKAVRKDDKPT